MDFLLPFLLRPQSEFQRDRLVDLLMSCLPSESKTQSSPNIPKHTVYCSSLFPSSGSQLVV
jgi:hypothetical protein